MPRRKFNELAKNIEDIMMESLPKLVDDRIKEYENLHSDISSQVNDAIANHIPLQVATTPCRPSIVRPRDQDNPHHDAHPEGENNAKRQKTTEHGTFELGGSCSGQEYESESGPSMSCNQEQSDDFYFWSNSYASDDDVIPNERVSQELV
ncbi:hypothetical protein Tco_1243432 [Tanacetum coccineum]